jgi:hypothetical protein
MIDDRHWRAAYDKVRAEGRRRCGDPPTEEELIAWARGTLPDGEKARIGELLAYYPELARDLTAGGSDPDTGPVLSAADLEADWKSVEAKLLALSVPVSRRARDARPWYLAAAAALLAGIFGWMMLQARMEAARLSRQLRAAPAPVERTLLLPDGERGAQSHAIEIASSGAFLYLAPALINQPAFPAYEAEILDLRASPPAPIWHAAGLRRHADETVEILLAGDFLKTGIYRVVVSGVSSQQARILATYTIHVPASPENH